jgi:hypothetical protein
METERVAHAKNIRDGACIDVVAPFGAPPGFAARSDGPLRSR